MNNVINKFLLAGDKFMPERHLRQPRFVYSACGPFTRHKERIKEFKRTGDTHYIYRNELDKACFQHDSAYAYHKDLINRTEADRVLRDKAYDIASNPKYDGYQRDLASMVYKFFDKKSMDSGFKKLKNTTKSTAEPSALARNSSILADERHKPVIRKINKRKVYSEFKDNIWGVDLADMQSLSRKNKDIKYLLCAIDLYSKYAFVTPFKDKKGISIVNAFNKIIKQSNRKPNKIWVDQGGEFYSIHSTIKMKPIDVKNNKRVYIDEHNEKDSKFKVGDRARISRYKNIFAKGYAPNWSSEIFIVDKIDDTVPYMYNLKDLNDEEIIGSFYDRELQKTKF